jgi:multidrug efflux pump subunit AcrB
MSFFDLMLQTARLRLPPILMTSLTFILGLVPLVVKAAPVRVRRSASAYSAA